jgi:hypothetical protein
MSVPESKLAGDRDNGNAWRLGAVFEGKPALAAAFFCECQQAATPGRHRGLPGCLIKATAEQRQISLKLVETQRIS